MGIHLLPLQVRVVRNLRRRGVTVLTRRQWGTRYPGLYYTRLKTHPVSKVEADTLWQHITVTFDSGVLVGDFKTDMRTVERIGFERFGTGFSYNFAVDMKTGMVGVGQMLKARGSHTINDKGIPGYSYNQNYVARAVACLGVPGDTLSDKAKISLSYLIAALIDEKALTVDPDYVPHALVANKSCPTPAVINQMPEIKRLGFKWSKRRTKTLGR